MKQNGGWQWKNPTLTTVIVLTATIFTTQSFAVNRDNLQRIQSSSIERTLQKKQGEYQLAKYSGSCRQVMARNGLYVMRKPTLNSSVVTLLDYGQQVTIRNSGKNGWVGISSPTQGYISQTDYLASCHAEGTPSGENFCRQVVTKAGLVVRRSPSINAARIGFVSNRRNVLIEKRGKNGWVPITAPYFGYVPSKHLRYCQQGSF